MTTLSCSNSEPENPETEYINFSDYFTLVKDRILSSDTLSDKFREYASIKLTIPTRKLIDIDYFNENNIDTTTMCQFHTNNIKHVDYSISFGLTRGFLALYPDKELSEEEQLVEMNNRLNTMTICNLHENKIQLDFLDSFIIAIYVRTWMWHGRGMEYSSCVYYDTSTKELYATHNKKGVYPVIIEQYQNKIEGTLKYVIGAFNQTIKYKERYLLDEVLMIPITGMHEALILNQKVLDGYKYNAMTEDSWNDLNNTYQEIQKCVFSHFNNNMDDIQIEAAHIYNDQLMKVYFDKYKVSGITDLVEKMVNIYLEYDICSPTCLDEIMISILADNNDLLIVCMLVNYPAYHTHNLDYLYGKACDKGLDKVVRLLISFSYNTNNMLNHNYNKDYGFIWACQKGNLRLAKFIYSLGNVDINRTFNGSAFNSACSANYLELAKWIYTLEEVDIHMNLSYGFILSCSRNHEEVYRWMWEIATDKERYFEDWRKSDIYMTNYDTYYNILH